jgi:formylmethanofuran dehydrogenase subunit A
LLLLMKNPWQLSLTIDHPNGGSFLHFPAIVQLLMNKPLRDHALAQAHPYATRHTSLAQIDREMTIEEIAVITRAAPARMLGLRDKGHLNPGGQADITLYRQQSNPAEGGIQDMFARPACVIKDGQVIARQGRCLADVSCQRLRAGLAPNRTGQELLETWQQSQGSCAPGQFGLRKNELAALRVMNDFVDKSTKFGRSWQE